MIRNDSGVQRVDANAACVVKASEGDTLVLETEDGAMLTLWYEYPTDDPQQEDSFEVPPGHTVEIIDHGAEGYSVRIYPRIP